nr:DegV family protein [Phytoactinopolyspora halotolerans]
MTDSTAYLPAKLVAEHGIEVVPLQVVIAGRAKNEDGDVGPREVAAALRRHEQVSTSRPSPEAFRRAYQAASAEGATHVVSVHLSSRLSGTVDAARLAAADAPIPVQVVDSRSVGMGLGFAALAAARSAERGDSAERVAASATEHAASSSVFFYVDTLEYLRRGGRIGAASAMFGTALAIKPLLHLVNGGIAPLEKVRTGARAVARLEDLTLERAGRSHVDIAVHHLDNAVRAEQLANRLADHLPRLGEMVVAEVGAVIGAHAGPGMLAVVISPR